MQAMSNAPSFVQRRHLLRAGMTGGLAAALGAAAVPLRVGAEDVLMTAYGAGVNLKLMPDESGNPVVPMREAFAFDPIYAQCIVDDNAERFAMDTYELGRVVIEPRQFFMAMYADTVGLHEIHVNADGSRTATMLGTLFCATFAGTASFSVG